MGAVTTIPTTTDVAAVPPTGSTAIKKYSITEADVAAIEAAANALRTAPTEPGGKAVIMITDIHDEAKVEAVIALHKSSKKVRTTVDRERLEANRSIRETVDLHIEWNNNAAESLQVRANPIEEETGRLIEWIEAERESERVAKKTALRDSRKAQLLEAVGEFTEILSMWPADLSDAGVAEFDSMLMMAGVHATGKRQLADAARIAKEQADKALAEQQERDRLAEVERLRLQAIEDANRKAAQAELDAKMAAFEKQQAEVAELQRKADADREARIAQENADRMEREAVQRAADQAKLDAQNADLERQRAEIKTKQLAHEAEMMKLAREADERVRLRLEADAKMEILEAEAAEKLARQQHEDAERQRLEAMRPDIERLREWVESIARFSINRPVCGLATSSVVIKLKEEFGRCIDKMREILT